METWRSAHAILSRLQGDVEDHALLLCSLLLGWGLDAWVALGTIQTPSTDGEESAVSQSAVCWSQLSHLYSIYYTIPALLKSY